MMRALPFVLILALSLLPGCRKAVDSTPRRYAYPRIEPYDTVYRRVIVGPVEIYVNAAADVSSTRPDWLDIAYPRYGTTLHISAGTTDDIAAALANRHERIALNLGAARARTHDFTVGDFECTVVECPDAGMTPVQLLAASPRGIIVSGTANITGSSSPVDSIRPIVSALTADAIKMLTALSDD